MISPKESIAANNGKVINLQSEINKDVDANTFSKTEKIVTDESKTADKSSEVHDIDLTILDERGAFIGNEDGSLFLLVVIKK